MTESEGPLSENELIEHARDGMFLSDEQGLLVIWNREMERITGFERAQVIGRSLWDIHEALLPDSPLSSTRKQLLQRWIRRVLATGETTWRTVAEIPLKRPDGTIVVVQAKDFTIPGQHGYRIGSVVRDVTGTDPVDTYQYMLAELKRTREDYAELFHHSLDAFARFDVEFGPDGRPSDFLFLEVNRAFEELAGVESEHILGMRVGDVLGIRKSEADQYYQFFRIAETGAPSRFELYIPPLSKHFLVSAYRPRPGQIAVILSDITPQISLIDQVEESGRIIQHDMKNHVSSIASLAQMLERCPGGDPRFPRIVRGIAEAAESALCVLRTHEKIRRLEQGTLEKPTTDADLLPILKQVIEELDGLRSVRDIRIDCLVDGQQMESAGSLRVTADSDLLGRALLNLIKNAIEASPPGETVRIHAAATDPVRIDIHNLGAISETVRASMFLKYMTTKSEGTGLGLYSSRMILLHHDGEITFTSDPDEGTHLLIELPPGREKKDR